MAGYTVTGVAGDEVPDANGDLQDAFDVTFTVDGAQGSFTVTVPRAGDPVGAAQAAIEAIASQVGGILAL